MKAMSMGRWTGWLMLGILAACKHEAASPPVEPLPAAVEEPVVAAPATQAELKDVIENDASHVVGISYPADINALPGLAKVLGDYASAARADLAGALAGLGSEKPTMPYELSLSFEKTLDTPTLVAVSADGSLYTGGAHGQPLVARFVWLKQPDAMLTAQALVPGKPGWVAIADYVREQLHTQASMRADADGLSPQDRQALLKNANAMIDDGTKPVADNYSQFLPVLDAAGHVAALRFVFPPYQVGPYSDGTQSVDVPSSLLRPYVAPEYAELFAP